MPKHEMQLMPVIATRSAMRAVPYHAIFRRSTWRHAIDAIQIAVALSFVAAQAIAAPEADLFSRLFERTLAKKQTIRSIRANFTETTTSSLLQRPLVSHGTVIAAPPARVLMTYADPERRVVAIDGKSLVVSWPDRNERETINIEETMKQIDRYFTQATIDQLRSMFDVTAEADGTLRNTDRVDMRPKRKQIKGGLEGLRLWIDRETLLLAQMEMTFPGGNRKTISLDDVVVNVPVNDAMFQIRP